MKKKNLQDIKILILVKKLTYGTHLLRCGIKQFFYIIKIALRRGIKQFFFFPFFPLHCI